MDGSRRTAKNGVTINRALMSGNPNYNLVRSLVAWRLKAFAAPTDISKFFNRIMLYPEDRQYISMMFTQSFDLEDPREWYVILVHTFGYSSTSAIAKGAMEQIIERTTLEGLLEVTRTLSLAYVDDCNTSVDTLI